MNGGHMSSYLKFTPVLFISLFLLASCTAAGRADNQPGGVSGGAPSWVAVPKKDKIYFYAAGYIEDTGNFEDIKAKAFQNAKGRIADAIFEETSVEKVLTTSGGLGDNEELRKSYRETVKSSSTVNLSGVEIDDVYYEKSTDSGLDVYKVWVLARISYRNLERERNRIIQELQRKLELVDNTIREALKLAGEGRIIDAVGAYITAAVSSAHVRDRMDEFPIYINQAGNLLDKISIEPLDNPGSIDTAGGGKCRFAVFYADRTGKIPLSGIKTVFVVKNNSGDYTRADVSQTNGTVECDIKKLAEVKGGNRLYASISLDFSSIEGLGADYSKYYSILIDRRDKISAYTEFRTVSSINRNIPAGVMAFSGESGSYEAEPDLAAEARSYLIGKGYKVVNYPKEVSPDDISQGKPGVMSNLISSGIKRIMLIMVREPAEIEYNTDLGRFLGVYSVTVEFLDTSTGEIVSSGNFKVSATAMTKNSVKDSFIKAAGKQIKNLIE